MLSIGKFSRICEVSTKALRYYDEIELLKPSEINPENGYRYYAINQLETMLLINRLKQYNFSLEEIRSIIKAEELQDETLYVELLDKKKELKKQIQNDTVTLAQLEKDILVLKQGKSILSYLDNVDIQLVEIPTMYLISIRKMVHKMDFTMEYEVCFTSILENIMHNKLTMVGPPMVLFHSDEFTPAGLDTEFAIPIKEYATGTRDFQPGLCLKTVLHGAYAHLASIYTKLYKWAELHGYENNGALFEVYVSDPSTILNEQELVTEIYYLVKKNERRKQG